MQKTTNQLLKNVIQKNKQFSLSFVVSFVFFTYNLVRSLSLDVNGRRSTMRTDNSFKKLDTSYTEATSNNQLLGHRRCKSRIPKLNLEVLPNYHGNSNKSIND